MRPRDDGSLYDRDFYVWTQDQARRLREIAGDNRLDVSNLADEVEDLGKRDKRALESHVVLALQHIAQIAAAQSQQPHAQWLGEVRTHLLHARKIARDSPSLPGRLALDGLWADARAEANANLRDHGDPEVPGDVPCPAGLDDLLAEGFDVGATAERLRARLGQ